ncbi:MAG: GntR family transcriptional regulator [Anaerolineae bacterium]|nr:GntR family transcriptional regulator [Anaerolineae bacterium]
MADPFGPIENNRKTLAAQVHEHIRRAILTSALKPGTRIDQNQMAEALKVSLAPVREALKELGAEGLVTIIPRRGAFVTEVSLTDLEELYFARALIEGETIYHAIPHLSDADMDKLQVLVDKMKDVAEGEDVSDYIALNREFHLRIYSALNNQHLLQTIRSMWERSELYRYRYMLLIHDTVRIHAEHQAILDACKDRDRSRARQAAIHHIQQTQRELHEYLQQEITADTTH